jgi:hypothetical protein
VYGYTAERDWLKMVLPEGFRPSRDAGTLIKEVDATIRIKDIQRVHRYRERLESKWWESGVIVMLFISGSGFIITIYKLIPANHSMLFYFIFFWFLLFILTLIATLELVLVKIAALRVLYDLNSRLIQDLEKRDQQQHQPPS